MIPCRFFAAIILCLTGIAPVASSQATRNQPVGAKVPMKVFTDPATGVSFDYPAPWTLTHQASFYLSPMILIPDQAAQAIVYFNPAGNLYSKTNLGGLEFTYLALPESNQASCLKSVVQLDPEAKPPATITINGTEFFHFITGDAGLCHQASRDIYGTYRGRSCLLFEAAFYTICPDPDDGRSELTPAQSKALKRHLDTIVQTIRIGAK
jgi:hypothetical protein